uniref:Dysbindin domain-containing protein 1 n=2 Tax=Equus asinus TaxID=9793 RepID=A0A9L0K5L0_EQUAS
MEPPEGASPGGECGPSPREPPSPPSTQRAAAPSFRAHSSAAPRGRADPPAAPSPRCPGGARKPGPPRWGAGPGAPPGNSPRAGLRALGARPRPLVLCAPGRRAVSGAILGVWPRDSSRTPFQPSRGTEEIVKEVEVPQAALGTPAHGPGDSGHSPVAEEEVGIPIPAPGLLQVTERRQPLSSVSSLEVHFDLLDLTELTDMSDQELAEVFADSDDENLTSESPAGLHPLPRAGCLRSPSWTRTRAEQNREKQPVSDAERQPGIVDTFLTVERPKED